MQDSVEYPIPAPRVRPSSRSAPDEFIIVALVRAAFPLHLRSALAVILSLPIGVLAAFILIQAQGLNANTMSLGGIAVAIGAMVDAAVMVENVHKHLKASRERGALSAAEH